MKKNRMMRLASLILVLTLLSTCAISGTFAKYVTSATADDAARVAKWGVVISTWNTDNENATVFAADYDTTVTAANSTDLLVAPGTANSEGIKFELTGTPEVDVKLDFVMNYTSDVVVTAGDYLDWTTGNDTDDTFNVAADYYPVVFTLTNKGESVATGNLAAIETAFEALSETKVDANTDLEDKYGEYVLTWEWAFEVNDKADTLLGNNIAGIATDNGVVTNLAFDISITATQID